MPILSWYISQVIGQNKFDKFTSKMRKKRRQCIKTPKHFQYRETSCLGTSQKIVHVFFCVFQTNLNKAVNILFNYQNESEIYK